MCEERETEEVERETEEVESEKVFTEKKGDCRINIFTLQLQSKILQSEQLLLYSPGLCKIYLLQRYLIILVLYKTKTIK